MSEQTEQMRIDIADFLHALDRGYFGGDVILALENSAFVDALRKHTPTPPNPRPAGEEE